MEQVKLLQNKGKCQKQEKNDSCNTMLGLGLVQNHFMNNATTKLCDESDNNKNDENNKNSTKKDNINGTNNTTISITRTASTHHQLNQ